MEEEEEEEGGVAVRKRSEMCVYVCVCVYS